MQSIRMLTGLLVAATAMVACERAGGRVGDLFDASALAPPAVSRPVGEARSTSAETPPGAMAEAQQPSPALPVPPPSAVARPAPSAISAPPRDAMSLESISDGAITAKVKRAIAADPALAGADVSVNTDHGVVSLTGVVASPDQSAIASAHAQRQDGVMRIDNHLAMNLR